MTLDDIRARCVEVGECWHWRAGCKSMHNRKYPQVQIDGKNKLVRRVAYELANGPIVTRRRIVPNCGDPCCVNPAHQGELSHSQVGKRAAKRGAWSNPARGAKIAAAKRAKSKHTLDTALYIRDSDKPLSVVAKEVGMSESMASAIRRGTRWQEYGANPFAGLGAR